jgi:large subunit ribosomal protein L29
MKVSELKDQTVAELQALCRDLSKEIYALNNELSMARKLEKPHLLREKRRDRARVKTVMRQKEKSNG